MNDINLSNNFDINSFLDNVMADAKQGASEDNKVTSARIKVHSDKIQDKRKEQIENLMEQMKDASSGGCLKFLKSVFKIFDILLKPLSAITAGKLKLEIGAALEKLQDAKKLQHKIGLQIDESKISKALGNLKRMLQEDFQNMEVETQIDHKETQKIIQMIEEVQEGFRSTANT